jgi:hypothetical protein
MSDDQSDSKTQVHWGDVYVSDQYDNDFTLSLRYLVRYAPPSPFPETLLETKTKKK